MKVALIAEWLDAWRGGAETSTLQFMRHLMARGVELHVFTRSRPSPTPGLTVHTISGASMSRTRRSVTFTHRVERLLESHVFDVVHAISPVRGADIYQPRGGTIAETIERNLALLRFRPARHLKRYVNRFNFKQRYMLALERRILGDQRGPIVVAISDYVARQLERHYALPEERIRRIFNGVDPDATPEPVRSARRAAIRREFGIAADDLLVIQIAHNFRLKGVHRWMEALARLNTCGQATRLRSLVIGKGDSPGWHRMAARLGIADRLHFVGPTERVADFRHAADVLVHPTYYDPCSRVVLEGLAAGLCCITTQWDGAAEVIHDGESGFVVADPDDTATICERVQELRDPQRRSQMGAAAAATASATSMDRHTSEMVALYESISTPVLIGS